MANPPKQKGTTGEREVMELLHEAGFNGAVRNPPSATWDITSPSGATELGAEPLEVLATRPDRGRWLATVDLFTLLHWLQTAGPDWYPELRVEVKRYARFSLHTIFEKKFGRRK